MSILIVCPRYAPDAGGIETLLAQVLPELAARGVDIVVAAGTDRADLAPFEVIDGIPVYRMPFALAMLSANPAEILEVSHRIRGIEADHEVTIRHLQGYGDIALWYALRAHRRRPLPLAVSVHGTFEWVGRLGPSAREFLGAADVITAVSAPVCAAIAEELGDPSPPVRLIPNGLRVDDAPAAPWPAAGFLLGVGRLLEQKGFDVAVEALGCLADTHPTLELVIAGAGPNADDVRRQAERWGVASRVRMLGRVSHDRVRSLMNDASIVLVPSRHTEGFSLAALEAAHAARPVIASSTGGLGDTIEDGVTGVLVPPDRPVALARAIARVLDDPVGAARMGERGRERAEEVFGFDSCVDAYHHLYQELESSARSMVAAQVSARV